MLCVDALRGLAQILSFSTFFAFSFFNFAFFNFFIFHFSIDFSIYSSVFVDGLCCRISQLDVLFLFPMSHIHVGTMSSQVLVLFAPCPHVRLHHTCTGRETRPTVQEPIDYAGYSYPEVSPYTLRCRTPLSQPGKPVRLPREKNFTRAGGLRLLEEVETADPRTR